MDSKEIEYENIKSMILEILLESTSSSAVNLWFSDIKLILIDDNEAVFVTTSDLKKKVISQRFSDQLKSVLSQIIGFEPNITIMSSENGEGEISKATNSQSVVDNQIQKPQIISTVHGYKPEYTFDNFVVGSSNNYAAAFAKQVASKDYSGAYLSKDDNPFFIYGPSGVGKSHLLYAISNKILENYPSAKIKYITGEEFNNQILDAININKNTPAFREKYRTVDVLLIDDIHFIAGKPTVQEEFFNTFNALYNSGKQIILTSDRPPNEMKQLEDRLRTRFMSGLITDIQLPDFDLRCAIINQKATQNGLNISYDVISFLAENVKSSIRQLEGVVKKLGAIQLLEGGDITLDRVKNSIKEFIHVKESDTKRMDDIIMAVSKKYGVSRDDILSDKRNAEIMLPRHICVYLARTCTNLSQAQIGKSINRDRTTVISSENKVKSLMESDHDFALDINELVRQIKN
ncbi:MAG: chromosomal replication initiator protein DnaA [Ruminococcaceae bacterium]|nr:chromosomal replication initiator protein DnaA [Oscillospiraceae bacterium]